MTSTSFWSIFAQIPASLYPTRAVWYDLPSYCPCWLGADCCLESDVVANLGLQVLDSPETNQTLGDRARRALLDKNR